MKKAKEATICGKAFWETKTVRDTVTISLDSFDSNSESLDVELVKGVPEVDASGMSDLMMAAGPGQESMNSKWVGEVTAVAGGRFGGGIKLAGKGAVETGPVEWGKSFGSDRALTIDVWVKPDQGGGRAILIDLPARKGSSLLKIVREVDGGVALIAANGQSLVHPRKMPAGTWTHLALVWSLNEPMKFLVNGTPVPVPSEISASFGAPAVSLAPKWYAGAERDLKNGFHGLLDELRMSSCDRPLYEYEDDSFHDAAAVRRLINEPPYFVRADTPMLACSFDGTLTPEVFSGLKVLGKASTNSFRPGIRGLAYDMSNAKKDGFRLVGSSVFPWEAGAVEFWMSPLDWDNSFIGDYLGWNVKSQMLLQFGRTTYYADRAARGVMIRTGRGLQETAGNPGFVPIHPGVWTHVMCVWGGGKTANYLNGKRQPANQISLGSNYYFDMPDWKAYEKAGGLTNEPELYGWALIPTATLIDEWRLYTRAFSEEEVANAYARWFPDATNRMAALPTIRVQPTYDFNTQTFKMQLTCLPVNGTMPSNVHVTVLGRAESLFDGKLTLDASFSAMVQVKRDLPFGEYPIKVVSLTGGGKPLATNDMVYTRSKPVWWENALGKTHTVPEPWSPIQVAGDKVTVWGRSITLAAGGLPAQIQAAGTNVLAAPLRLQGVLNGKPIEFKGEPVVFGARGDDLTEWSSCYKGDGITAEVKGSIEYDGMMSFAVTLGRVVSSAAEELESLTLDVSLHSGIGSQMIVNGGGNEFRGAWDIRMVPAGAGRVWDSMTSYPKMQKAVERSTFCPVVWLGDDARGLCFFGENDQGWTLQTNSPSQEIRREDGAVVYRMNVISRPVTLEQPRTFKFVIHPTPTKPLPAGWRAYNRGGVDGKFWNLHGIDACISPTLTAPKNSTVHLGMTFVMEPPAWEDAKANGELLRARAGKGNPRLFYMNYSWPKLGPSMADYRGGLWSGGRMLWTREVEDYMTWIIGEYIKRDIIDGIYIDDVSLGSNWVPFGTAYAVEGEQMQPGFNTLGFRRFLKRVRMLFIEAGKQPMIIPHMTYCFEIPALSFADACVNGEDRDIRYPAQHNFVQAWGRDELRIQSSSEKWGFITYWKNTIEAKGVKPGPDVYAWNYRQSRSLHALAVQNDLWYMWGGSMAPTIEPAMTAFGIGAADVRFIPNWKRQGILEVTEARLMSVEEGGVAAPGRTNAVMVCAYARPDRALMLVSNLGSNDQTIAVTVTPGALFDKCRAVRFKDVDPALIPPVSDLATRDDIKKAGDAMTVDLESQDGLPDLVSAADLLSGKKPAEKAGQRLGLMPAGNSINIPVRAWDFRVVEIKPERD